MIETTLGAQIGNIGLWWLVEEECYKRVNTSEDGPDETDDLEQYDERI
jgi:hypothetical protein